MAVCGRPLTEVVSDASCARRAQARPTASDRRVWLVLLGGRLARTGVVALFGAFSSVEVGKVSHVGARVPTLGDRCPCNGLPPCVLADRQMAAAGFDA